MKPWRIATGIAVGSALAWAGVVACGSDRPAPANLNHDPDAFTDGGASFDSGVFPPGTSSGPCTDDEASTPFPNQGFGIELTFDGAPPECGCVHPNQNGTAINLPCGTSLCMAGADRMWECRKDQTMHFYQGGGVGTTCDAASVPPGSPPCTPPR